MRSVARSNGLGNIVVILSASEGSIIFSLKVNFLNIAFDGEILRCAQNDNAADALKRLEVSHPQNDIRYRMLQFPAIPAFLR